MVVDHGRMAEQEKFGRDLPARLQDLAGLGGAAKGKQRRGLALRLSIGKLDEHVVDRAHVLQVVT